MGLEGRTSLPVCQDLGRDPQSLLLIDRAAFFLKTEKVVRNTLRMKGLLTNYV
eukprot:COSAG01_NODE_1444_length_10282_cov_17.103506_5_plen_53_part_00